MAAIIDTLIDKVDSFEIVRNKVAIILADEQANQVALATTAGKPDPNEWALKVYAERAEVWQQVINASPDTIDDVPLVNVWYDNSSFTKGASNTIERQDSTVNINVDVIGVAIGADDGGSGQLLADEQAAQAAHRGVRLVRNILMAAAYVKLDMLGVVGDRWIDSIVSFQPQLDVTSAVRVHGSRVSLAVRINEFAPEVSLETLELVNVDVKRAEDGSILASAQYDFT